MKTVSFDHVDITSGYLSEKQELNRKTTINAVYDRFYETGRIGAFDFAYDGSEDKIKPHVFWDSDVAKWMEGVSYITRKNASPELMAKVEELIQKIKEHQCEDGYFNSYFTVCEPEARFTDRHKHELYCAGHLMEAAVAYAQTTGKYDFLDCMEKYSDLIYKIFVEEKSAQFATPGHEEIELALIRMYDLTGKKKFLDLAKYFIDTRGTVEEPHMVDGIQSHKPLREQEEATGHCVRAVYLYTGMAMLAERTGDEALVSQCRKLFDDIVYKKMFVTGGIGSECRGERFTVPFDLTNDHAYTETCAAIGLIYFANAMLALENDAKYADVIERTLYNGFLSGLSLSGDQFFYENPLEITLREHFESTSGKRRFPITQRPKIFDCSCCPPNINRMLPSLGNYIYGIDGNTLYVNQFTASTLSTDGVTCTQTTNYPNDGAVTITANGCEKVAIRIPEWCESFKINKAYVIERGYAMIENDGTEISVDFDMTPKAVFADCRIKSDINRLCVMRGPIVYCAESVDNVDDLHSLIFPSKIEATETFDEIYGLVKLEVPCRRRLPFEEGRLYSSQPPKTESFTAKLIPYNCFANRGECDMLIWFCGDYS